MENKSKSNINQINQVLRNKSESQKNSAKSLRHTIVLLSFSSLQKRYFMFGHM